MLFMFLVVFWFAFVCGKATFFWCRFGDADITFWRVSGQCVEDYSMWSVTRVADNFNSSFKIIPAAFLSNGLFSFPHFLTRK